MLRINFDIEEIFWVANPQFKYREPFKSLYNEDKSRQKKESSTIMWFLCFCYNKESIFYNTPTDERYATVGEEYCGDVNYYDKNKEYLDILIPKFITATETQADRSLREWNDKMEERSRVIKETKYTFDYYEEDARGRPIIKKGTADQLDKMQINTKKLYDLYGQIQKDLATEEEKEGTGKGGSIASLSDRGEI